MIGALSYSARRNGIHLRIVAYEPSLEPIPEGTMRVVLQSVEHGRPIAEDPLHVEITTPLFLAREIHQARMEGWDIHPWETRLQ